MAYSEDYRKRTIEYYQEGHTQAEVLAVFKVHPGTLRDWEARMAAGSLAPIYPKTRKPRKIPPEKLIQYIEENPDAFLAEIGAYFGCSAEAVRKALNKLGITRKKKTFDYVERCEKAREEYRQQIESIPVSRRIYIDESGINRFYFRLYARALRGNRVHGHIRGRKFARLNVVAGYCDGKTLGEYCYSGTTTAQVFEDWFCDFLLPETQAGDVIIMDNASFHNKKRLRKYAAIHNVSIIFLPPYSPDYNPIEHVWANLKRFLRNTSLRFNSLMAAVYWFFFLGYS